MQISPIQQYSVGYSKLNETVKTQPKTVSVPKEMNNKAYSKIPVWYNYGAKINFSGRTEHKSRRVDDVTHDSYLDMKDYTKRRLRKKCENFDCAVNKEELFDSKNPYLPLASKRNMDEFIKTSRIYLNYKDNPIICLGRSPKWFLNTAQWMKDGIPPYKFVAFSKYWYRPDPVEGMRRIDDIAPEKNEVTAYRRYLRRIQADPQTIVNDYKNHGKKTIITDYISTGKGATSFLEVLSNYASDKGILEDFAKSIQIVGLGSMDYLESFYYEDEEIPEPKVIMPEKLRPFRNEIKQEYYDMDYDMFREMLLNQNTNECRSTYYPHEAWTIYNPDRFKTGLIKNMNKVKKLVEEHKNSTKSFPAFTPAMQDFRNLLNFRILDALNARNILSLIKDAKA